MRTGGASMIALTESALGCLAKAGWSERYRWDPRGWRESVQAMGFRTSSAAASFLKQFGGLTLARLKVTLDPVLAAGNADPTDEARCRECVGVDASIVGTDGGYLNLWIADDGKMVLSIEADFRVIGDDPLDGMNAMCEGNDYQVVR